MRPTVLFAARLMPPVGGGIERLSEDVLQALQRNFEVVDLSNRGARWTQLPYLATVGPRLRMLASRRASAVVDGGDATLSPALAMAKAPSILRVQGLDLRLPNVAYQRIIRKYLPRMDAICPCSGPSAALLEPFGIDSERIHVIHPAADPPPGWAMAPEPGRILFVGRLVERKGLPEFVSHVWPIIHKQAPYSQLHVVGDGPDRARLVEAVKAAPGAERIELHGALPRESLERQFQVADLLVMPNRPRAGDFEGFGIVAIEAAVRGVPVVARAVDGVVDAVVPGKTGVLVERDDAQIFASAILEIIERNALPNRHALQEDAISRYSSARLASEYARVVDAVWSAHGTL